jgi:drug/metabolite transporter (DMT)-like permease
LKGFCYDGVLRKFIPFVSIDRRTYLISLAIAIAGSLCFAGKAILIKLSYRYGTTSEVLLTLRMVFSLPLFWLVYFLSKQYQNQQALTKKDVLQLLWLGFSGYFLSSYLDFQGLHYISAGLERIVLYLTPAIVVLFSYFFLHKPISKFQWISIAVGYLGVILAFIDDLSTKGSDGWIGMVLVFGSACLYANYLIFSGEIVKRIGSIRLVTYASSFSVLCSLIQILFHSPQTLFEQPLAIYQLCLVNAVFCTVMPMFMIMIAVQRIGSTITSQVGILGPIATIFMGSYFLQETVGIFQVCGLILVIMAVWLLMRPKSEQIVKPAVV